MVMSCDEHVPSAMYIVVSREAALFTPTVSYDSAKIHWFKMASKKASAAWSVFRKNYGGLTSGLQSHLSILVAHLYSNHLVSPDSKNKILDINSVASTIDRCTLLLNDVEDRIRRDHSSLEKFCEVLCHQDIDLAYLGEPMRRDFQQLCETSPKPTFHGSYSSIATTKSTEPVSESQSATAMNGYTPSVQPSRLLETDLHASTSDTEKPQTFVKSFATPQQAQEDSTDSACGDTLQVVPVKESSYSGRMNAVPIFDDLVSAGAKCSAQDPQEKRLYEDMVSTSYKALQECENCTRIRAECERKINKMKKYYENCSAKAASTKFELEVDKKSLSRVLEIQMEEKWKQLEESKERSANLQCQVDELQDRILELQTTKDEHKERISSKERELYKIKQLAKECPIYSDEKKLESFKRKKKKCDKIQSLMEQFFASLDPRTKSKLKEAVHAEFTHLNSLGRRRSISF